jgi:hypothetical protein
MCPRPWPPSKESSKGLKKASPVHPCARSCRPGPCRLKAGGHPTQRGSQEAVHTIHLPCVRPFVWYREPAKSVSHTASAGRFASARAGVHVRENHPRSASMRPARIQHTCTHSCTCHPWLHNPSRACFRASRLCSILEQPAAGTRRPCPAHNPLCASIKSPRARRVPAGGMCIRHDPRFGTSGDWESPSTFQAAVQSMHPVRVGAVRVPCIPHTVHVKNYLS